MRKTPSKEPLAKRAVAYVRMSTERQDHSIGHQLQRITQYASEHHMQLVRVYADEGKSGLVLAGRSGLAKLIREVHRGDADFEVVLVFDVSRWGRFQDTDESAHYEYVCRRAGIQVEYCAEPFANDGSPLAAMVKGFKRAMAAEYSRELSAKVFAAQVRLSSAGFKPGGIAGYGIRRLAVAGDGTAKRVLQAGERKPALTDRVLLIAGPEEEVAVVRRIYRWYIHQHLTDTAIAAKLSAQGVPNFMGVAWHPSQVKSILVNEKYAGVMVYNRTSRRLSTKTVHNPTAQWVRHASGLTPMISPAIFRQAQNERMRRRAPRNWNHFPQQLQALYAKHGRVSAALIDADPRLPSAHAVRAQFGTLATAYAIAGLPLDSVFKYAVTRHRVREQLKRTVKAVEGLVERAGKRWCREGRIGNLVIDGSVRLTVVVCRARFDEDGRVRWKIPLRQAMPADFVLAARLDQHNVHVFDYFLLATAAFSAPYLLCRIERPGEFSAYRYRELGAIFGLAHDGHRTLPG
ncbi:recombinase family protein [Pseudoduganella violacea]|uniref:DNA invertase Pin-like site-specific DNA recombinase n=1 Tax=Pseudoduganella violacea TaxID=1715466 RepID=A0A7W5FXF1_9BURK|nr:recombinase family protein [Pseudoduganella violacea]MBB3122198.1 DNA invertase Pin-like site-specific DNA recombinase [Pseudoduganella violacea]